MITVRDTTPPLVDAGNYGAIVENSPVNLDASGSHDNVAIADYQWDFGDGTFENSTIPSVVHTYTKPGVYMV
ncbi:MAG: PKD domain-containing protein, partial [Gammaproteobacteria bacterium]|nr:PKD domain-containing protein [Gammaproteobacteria bacterium]